MPKFAANLTMMFTEVPFLDRFAAAARAGFSAVEFLVPYDHLPEAVAEAARDAGVSVILFNLPPGDWGAGERGLTGLPGREEQFRESVNTALRYAGSLGTKQLHAMAGIAPKGSDLAVCRDTLVANLKYAAERAKSEGVTLLLEAINTRDMPGYFLSRQGDAQQHQRAFQQDAMQFTGQQAIEDQHRPVPEIQRIGNQADEAQRRQR